MDGFVLPPTPGGSHTTTSSYIVHITDKMNMHTMNLPPTSISFTTQTAKQDKSPSLYLITTLQVGQVVTHIDSNGTRVPEISTKFIICTISGNPMYLIEVTPKQTNQSNNNYIYEPSDPNIFFIDITIRSIRTKTPPKTLQELLDLVPTAIPL